MAANYYKLFPCYKSSKIWCRWLHNYTILLLLFLKCSFFFSRNSLDDLQNYFQGTSIKCFCVIVIGAFAVFYVIWRNTLCEFTDVFKFLMYHLHVPATINNATFMHQSTKIQKAVNVHLHLTCFLCFVNNTLI